MPPSSFCVVDRAVCTLQAVGTWMVSPAWSMVISAYQNFWHNPLLLFLLSIPLAGIALWSANRPVFRLNQGID